MSDADKSFRTWLWMVSVLAAGILAANIGFQVLQFLVFLAMAAK